VAILVKDLEWLILLELQPMNREPIHLLLVRIFLPIYDLCSKLTSTDEVFGLHSSDSE